MNAVSEISVDTDTLRPGAVWVALRPGSRSANRIVQRRGPKTPPFGKNGITYTSGTISKGTVVRWCTDQAWQAWVAKEGGVFQHISTDHIMLSAKV